MIVDGLRQQPVFEPQILEELLKSAQLHGSKHARDSARPNTDRFSAREIQVGELRREAHP
jgi:hypothetical protein